MGVSPEQLPLAVTRYCEHLTGINPSAWFGLEPGQYATLKVCPECGEGWPRQAKRCCAFDAPFTEKNQLDPRNSN